MARVITALPVYNEVDHVAHVVAEVRRYSPEVLVVDDGSNDGTSQAIAGIPGIQVVTHAHNRGYGAALHSAFAFARRHQYDVLVTIDCDGQHEPRRIGRFVAACAGWDIVSGSRYLKRYPGDSEPPVERRRINQELTDLLNDRLAERLGLRLTDAFCGFKAYRVEALSRLTLTETGYAMPIELWVQAAHAGLRICELPVPLIYLDAKRSFGGALDDAEIRGQYYRRVLDRSLAEVGYNAGPHAWRHSQEAKKPLCGECPA